jgi:uncharacterized protein (TIGR03083 family)
MDVTAGGTVAAGNGRPGSWPMMHAEREALADDLAGLTAAQWATPSLCPDWTVKDILAHLTAAALQTPQRFIGHFAAAGFKFNTMVNKDIAVLGAGSPAEVLAAFRRVIPRETAPPGPVDAMLGELVVHPEDIRRVLGITRSYPTETVARAADFYKKSNLLIGAKRRIASLTLRATDADWSHGTGPEVSGPLVSLLLAMTGRKVALADLSGDGLATLAGRMP